MVTGALYATLGHCRGDFTGEDKDNAITTQLIGNPSGFSMFLHLWNTNVGDKWSVAGEIEIIAKDIKRDLRGAVCFGFPEDAVRFDCVEFIISLSDPDNWSIFDSYQASGPKVLLKPPIGDAE